MFLWIISPHRLHGTESRYSMNGVIYITKFLLKFKKNHPVYASKSSVRKTLLLKNCFFRYNFIISVLDTTTQLQIDFPLLSLPTFIFSCFAYHKNEKEHALKFNPRAWITESISCMLTGRLTNEVSSIVILNSINNCKHRNLNWCY
jgi:hypothetical protein